MHIILILDFGYTDGLDEISTIADLAECTQRNYQMLDEALVMAQSCTHEYLEKYEMIPSDRLRKIDVGQSNTSELEDGGTYYVLRQVVAMLNELFMKPPEWMLVLESVKIVAHELHSPRAVKQAELLTVLNIEPAQFLPSKLYSVAKQWWCRNKVLWYAREIFGYLPLKIAGQL